MDAIHGRFNTFRVGPVRKLNESDLSIPRKREYAFVLEECNRLVGGGLSELLSPGEYETPYALNVDPQTNEVWITSNLSDRILRFDPETEQFVSYPSPTRVTFLRDLVFTPDGAICSSQSNLPAYAIEGGVPSFICLNPEGSGDPSR